VQSPAGELIVLRNQSSNVRRRTTTPLFRSWREACQSRRRVLGTAIQTRSTLGTTWRTCEEIRCPPENAVAESSSSHARQNTHTGVEGADTGWRSLQTRRRNKIQGGGGREDCGDIVGAPKNSNQCRRAEQIVSTAVGRPFLCAAFLPCSGLVRKVEMELAPYQLGENYTHASSKKNCETYAIFPVVFILMKLVFVHMLEGVTTRVFCVNILVGRPMG